MSSERVVHVEYVAEAGLVDHVLNALDSLWSSDETVDEEDRGLFALAVGEIAANIVEHARGREPIQVSVRLSMSPDALEAVFTDTAEPALIDLSNVAMPGWDAESGRGLALAQKTLDELTHETHEGNTWRLRRSISPGRPPGGIAFPRG